MGKAAAVLGSALFFVIAPATFGFVAPWWIAGWHIGVPLFGEPAFRFVGLLLVVAGLVPLIDSFARFALEGLGTPAPIAPPQHLVVTGYYRYVRNPMYVGVQSIMLGNALILGDTYVLAYTAGVCIAFGFFVLLYEEPTLRRRYGAEYAEYCAHVPRWLPRFKPWTPATRE